MAYSSIGDTRLLTIPYQNSTDGESCLPYSPYSPKNKSQVPIEMSNDELLRQFSKYTIPCEKSFVPANLEIREQTGSGLKEDLRRIVVLSKDKLHYKVYRLQGSGPKIDEDEDVSMS